MICTTRGRPLGEFIFPASKVIAWTLICMQSCAGNSRSYLVKSTFRYQTITSWQVELFRLLSRSSFTRLVSVPSNSIKPARISLLSVGEEICKAENGGKALEMWESVKWIRCTKDEFLIRLSGLKTRIRISCDFYGESCLFLLPRRLIEFARKSAFLKSSQINLRRDHKFHHTSGQSISITAPFKNNLKADLKREHLFARSPLCEGAHEK